MTLRAQTSDLQPRRARLDALRIGTAAAASAGLVALAVVAWPVPGVAQPLPEGPLDAVTVVPPEVLARNKRNVVAFYELAFNQSKPREAIEKYAGAHYTQHNPEVADGKEGFIVPIRSPDAIRERLEYLYSHPEERAAMGRAALARVRSLNGWERYAHEVLRTYRERLKEQHAS